MGYMGSYYNIPKAIFHLVKRGYSLWSAGNEGLEKKGNYYKGGMPLMSRYSGSTLRRIGGGTAVLLRATSAGALAMGGVYVRGMSGPYGNLMGCRSADQAEIQFPPPLLSPMARDHHSKVPQNLKTLNPYLNPKLLY